MSFKESAARCKTFIDGKQTIAVLLGPGHLKKSATSISVLKFPPTAVGCILVITSKVLQLAYIKCEDQPEEFENCYGTEHLICETHSDQHIADDVEHYEQLDSFTSFPFELYISRIRRFVNTGLDVGKQAAQRFKEEICLEKKFQRSLKHKEIDD